MKLLYELRKYFPYVTVAVVYLWSMGAILMYRAEECGPDTIELRVGHWQLEASVREALNEMVFLYNEDRAARGLPEVRIVQDAIPDMIYPQWLTTQLMGGTAPDIIEVQLGAVPYHLWVQYYNRYFISISEWINQENPYNVGTSLEGVPFRLTFKDGMRNDYIEELQQYVSVPLSQFGVRIFYNKDLLKKITGSDRAPETYRDFINVCEQIRAATDEAGMHYIPIAGSKYHIGMWEYPMFDPLTYSVKDVADFNRDGFVDNGEQYTAFATGRLSFDHPAIRARYKVFREITDFFQTGYTGLTRDEAVFLFAQQKSVFMTTGTWDARSLLEQAEGQFDVGVMDYPLPTASHPEYGSVIQGPSYERIGGGFHFGITRTSKHPEVAYDFLQFMGSLKNNEKMNDIIGWIPSVRETQMPGFLQGFEPHLNGIYGNFNPAGLGGETWLQWVRQFALYQVKLISYEELADSFESFYIDKGRKDYLEQQKDWRRGMVNNEQFLAGLRSEILYPGEQAEDRAWIRYLNVLNDRQILPEIQHVKQMRLVEYGVGEQVPGPYEYSPEVIERVKERLRKKQAVTTTGME